MIREEGPRKLFKVMSQQLGLGQPSKSSGCFIAGPGAAKDPKSGSKSLPARIWPKTAVSAHFYTSSLIAGPGAAKVPKLGSKGFPARIWLKTAVSAHFYISSLIAGPRAAKVQCSSKKYSAQGSKTLPRKVCQDLVLQYLLPSPSDVQMSKHQQGKSVLVSRLLMFHV